MRISVLISTFNGETDIRHLLDSINNLTVDRKAHELEIIIRDDGSSDNTVSIIESEYSWAQLLDSNGQNAGFVASNNIAYAHATGEIICCINQDTILHPSFVSEAIKLFDKQPEICGINTNMIMPWIMPLAQFKRSHGEDIAAHEFILTSYGFVAYQAAEPTLHPANFMTGGAFFIRRSALPYQNNLFNPNIDMYCEDSDLSLRILRRQGKLVYSPKSIIYHNQAPKKANSLGELIKLLKITKNRFALFSRIHSPYAFSQKYPLLLLGIIKKSAYLGLPTARKLIAYCVNAVVVLLFLCLYPYWLIQSLTARDIAPGAK